MECAGLRDGAEYFNVSFAKLNNSVIRGTNKVFRTFKRNDHGGAYAHLHACHSRGTFFHSYRSVFGEQPPSLLQIATKAYTIATTKVDGAENCEEFALTKKN